VFGFALLNVEHAEQGLCVHSEVCSCLRGSVGNAVVNVFSQLHVLHVTSQRTVSRLCVACAAWQLRRYMCVVHAKYVR
jgi:hypothetical protein